MSEFGDAAVVDPATNHILMRSGDQGASLLDAAAAHESIADMLLAEMAAMGLNTASTQMVAWQGPGGVMMVMSAGQFIAICEAASAWARISMTQATEVAAAHATALQSMIPAEVATANRVTQHGLVMTNAFGIHSPEIFYLDGQYGEFWVQNATARSSYGSVVSAALAALAEPAPFSPDAADPAAPAAGVAQAAAQDSAQGSLQASAKTMTQAADAPLKDAASGPGATMSSMVGQLGGIAGQVGSSFGQITQVGGQLPSLLGQAPQMFSGMLGPLSSSVMGANGSTAAALAPEAAGAITPSLGGLGSGAGVLNGPAAVSSSFVRPASSFSAPTEPTLPGGWQGGAAAEAGSARPAGLGGGGLYGAPAALARDAQGSQQAERPGRTMQIAARPSRGEPQRI